MAWKTAKSRKWEKNGNRNGKQPQAGQGQKWQKKGPKMEICPFRFPFFFHFRLLAVFHAMPARQDPKTGQSGDRTMEMNGGSTAAYLACTLVVLCLF